MASPSRSFASSSSGLVPPHQQSTHQQRRMTSPSLPPPNPLGLPEPVYPQHQQQGHRPVSPLRHGYSDRDDDDDQNYDDQDDTRSQNSQAPSFSRYAANFARSVGSLMSPAKPSSALPSDAELEAEAERERDRSRREAERILMQEARDRRVVEERVLAMLEHDDDDEPMRPPPSRSQTFPTTPPSQGGSPTSGGRWWSKAKAQLTPTKDPLTPAQQVMQEAKTREKAQRKAEKADRKADRREREQQWPAKPSSKYTDPAFAALTAAAGTSPTPVRHSKPHHHHHHHHHQTDDLGPLTPPRARRYSTPASLASSPNVPQNGQKEQAPLYAHFDDEGVLDVPETLVTIARRFEKLEKWTVGHVRALEERMSDVEKWLVDKERERDEKERVQQETVDRTIRAAVASVSTKAIAPATPKAASNNPHMEAEMHVLREEMGELQGRIGELGREMAQIAKSAAAGASTNNNARPTQAPTRAPSTGGSGFPYALRNIPANVHRTPSARDSPGQPTSPPSVGAPSSRTRLPYPTGDYAPPPPSDILSPTNSPPARVMSPPIAGLPRTSDPFVVSSADRSNGPTAPAAEAPLDPPSAPALREQPRTGSVSPTPRKRYTVALGGPIRSPSVESLTRGGERGRNAPQAQTMRVVSHSRSRSQSRIETAFFVESPGEAVTVSARGHEASDSEREPHSGSEAGDDADHESESEAQGEETIGKSASRRLRAPAADDSDTGTSPASDFRDRRSRARSAYGLSNMGGDDVASPSPSTAPLRMRAQSTDRFHTNIPMASQSSPSLVSSIGLGIAGFGSPAITPNSFKDPLQVRREARQREASTAPPAPKVMAGRKVPVGQLVAFFDNSKKR